MGIMFFCKSFDNSIFVVKLNSNQYDRKYKSFYKIPLQRRDQLLEYEKVEASM